MVGTPKLLGLIPMFDLNEEHNPPAFFSAILLWSSAGLLWVCYTSEKRKNAGKAHYWKTLTFVFLFLGFDELFTIHEDFSRLEPFLSTYLQNYLHFPGTYLYWVIPYIILVVFFILYFLKFYVQLNRDSRLRFTLAGTLYVGAAIGLEITSAFLSKGMQLSPFAVSLLEATEEIIEMCGITVFIRGLLIHIRNQTSYPVFSFNIHYHSDFFEGVANRNEANVRTTNKEGTLPENAEVV
ncbi:MAG TPA: hypothetical protein VGN63_20810 [Flavisolibacter sp.]|nr:hypothetical protein [Flavisolibacter sp.]